MLGLLLRPQEPRQIVLFPFLITTPAPVLFLPLTFLHDPSVAITRTSSSLSALLILCFASSVCSDCWSFGGVLVVVKRGWEVRSCSQGFVWGVEGRGGRRVAEFCYPP